MRLLQNPGVHTVCKHRSSPKVPLSMRTSIASIHKQWRPRRCSRSGNPRPRPGATAFQCGDACILPADRKFEQKQVWSAQSSYEVQQPCSSPHRRCRSHRIPQCDATKNGIALRIQSTRRGMRVRTLAVRSHRIVHEQ